MLNGTLSFFHLLYLAFNPCSFPELLPANTVDIQPYLGKWYFKAAVSHREADIQTYRALDNFVVTAEEMAKDTLMLTGHMRLGDNCINQTWIYRRYPERNDLEVEGIPQRRSLLWSGKWANCTNCFIVQEIEPPLDSSGTEDSLGRFMLFARQSNVDAEVVTTFLKNAACQTLTASVKVPQEKEFCI